MLLTLLPNELWTMTWGCLPLRDRLTVTWVCRAWRSVAISTASIWNNIDFVIQESSTKRSNEWSDPITSLIEFIPIISERGKAGPLSISIVDTADIWSHHAVEEHAQSLAREIKRHQTCRLRNLHLSFSVACNVRNFLFNIDSFPVLVALTADCADPDDTEELRMNVEEDEEFASEYDFGPFLAVSEWDPREPISFPNLRQLLLNPRALGFVARPSSQETLVIFPCLEEIRLGVAQASDFAFVLESCPQLSIAHLSLKPYSTRPSGPPMPANYTLLGPRLRSLVLDDIPQIFEDDGMADERVIYLRASLHNLRLDYQPYFVPNIGLSIFAHLNNPLSVVVTVNLPEVTVVARELGPEDGDYSAAYKTREISFASDSAEEFLRNAALWTHLSPSLVVDIELNIQVIENFPAYLLPAALPSARHVKMIFGHGGDTPSGRRSLSDIKWPEILPGAMVDFVVQSPSLDLTFDCVKALMTYLEP